jgi:hypothetical protein
MRASANKTDRHPALSKAKRNRPAYSASTASNNGNFVSKSIHESSFF